MDTIKKVRKTLGYYTLILENVDIENVLNRYTTLDQSERLIDVDDTKQVIISNVEFDNDSNLYKIKLQYVVNSEFPHKTDKSTLVNQSIGLADTEALIETTHIILHKDNLIIQIEYNNRGPKIGSFIKILNSYRRSLLGNNNSSISYLPIYRKEFLSSINDAKYIKSIKLGISSVQGETVSDDIANPASAIDNINKYFGGGYCEVEVKLKKNSKKGLTIRPRELLSNIKQFGSNMISGSSRIVNQNDTIEDIDFFKNEIKMTITTCKLNLDRELDSNDMYTKMIANYKEAKNLYEL
jgi:hypothetical protein